MPKLILSKRDTLNTTTATTIVSNWKSIFFLWSYTPVISKPKNKSIKNSDWHRIILKKRETPFRCKNRNFWNVIYGYTTAFFSEVSIHKFPITIITAQRSGKASFVYSCMQTRLMVNKWKISISFVYVSKLLIIVITADQRSQRYFWKRLWLKRDWALR